MQDIFLPGEERIWDMRTASASREGKGSAGDLEEHDI